jgi:hypothetical protein
VRANLDGEGIRDLSEIPIIVQIKQKTMSEAMSRTMASNEVEVV